MADAAATARLFLALWPDEAARAAIVGWQAGFGWPDGARPTPAAQLHVTLHFLGDVARGRVAEIAAAMRVPRAPFEMVLDRAAVWPGGIAVLAPSSTPTALVDLHARLGVALDGLGLRTDARAYRPHVTLARRAAGARVPAVPGSWPRWQVGTGAVALVESAGGRYATLATDDRSFPRGGP